MSGPIYTKALTPMTVLNSSGLRGFDRLIELSAGMAEGADAEGDPRGASLWREIADRWLAKRADLLAG